MTAAVLIVSASSRAWRAHRLAAKLIALLALCTMALCAMASARAADSQCQAIAREVDPATASANGHYALAYCAARENRTELAFSELAAASARGFRDVERAAIDPDFLILHADPRWPSALAAIAAARNTYMAAINGELFALYSADQAERRIKQIDWKALIARDHERQQRVQQLAAAGALKHSDDYLHAAMIYQHGDAPPFFLQAQQWALKAVELDPGNDSARWLACAAQDRYLQASGKPQIWGTQLRQSAAAGPWTLEPLDRTQKTDAERIAMKVPPLAETQARLDAMNGSVK